MTIPMREESVRKPRPRGTTEPRPDPVFEVKKRDGKDIKFQRGQKIGKGSFGTVFKAIDKETGGFMAVKQIPISHLQEDQKRMIQQEVKLMEELNHPNIVRFFGSQRYPSHQIILMEYVAGQTLHHLIQEFGYLKEDLVRAYTKQILEGLVYCHQKKVIHRDIKGKNILITSEGICKLADFGSAKLVQDILAAEKLSMTYNYTPLWLAPEVVTGSYNSKVDIWSVGCTILEMASGKDPWSEHTFENSWQALNYIATKAQYPMFPKHLSPLAVEFLKLCFTRDPNKRPSAEELLKHDWIVKGAEKNVTSGSPRLTKLNEPLTLSPLSLGPSSHTCSTNEDNGRRSPTSPKTIKTNGSSSGLSSNDGKPTSPGKGVPFSDGGTSKLATNGRSSPTRKLLGQNGWT